MASLADQDQGRILTRLRANPVIKRMAADLAAAPLGEMAEPDGSPRFAFVMSMNAQFRRIEAANAGNERYTPDEGPRYREAIAEAVLAERAAMRAAWTGLLGGVEDESAITEVIERIRNREDSRQVVADIMARFAA